MDISQIIGGINESPLDSKVKEEAISKVNDYSGELEKLFARVAYTPPEVDFELRVTNEVLELIIPLFEKYDVPASNGRDTQRHIYKALGGEKEANYEC